MPDEDGYPSEQILKIIEKIDLQNYSIKDLIGLMQGEWWGSDCMVIEEGKETVKVEFHTVGWSGNEDLMTAFEKVELIGLFWQKSERGGHYWYEFPLCVWDRGLNLKGDNNVKK